MARFDASFILFVLLFQMCKVEKEAGKLTIPFTSVMERVAFLTGVSESTLYRLQRGDPDPIRKCPPKKFDLDDFDKEVVKRTVADLVRSKKIIPMLADIGNK